jgi:hypothetical protein
LLTPYMCYRIFLVTSTKMMSFLMVYSSSYSFPTLRMMKPKILAGITFSFVFVNLRCFRVQSYHIRTSREGIYNFHKVFRSEEAI